MGFNLELLEAVRGLYPPPVSDLPSQGIRDAREGSYLESKDDTFLVKKAFTYLEVKWETFAKQKKDYWVTELQLLSLTTGKTFFVEWEVDDALEVSETEAEIKLKQIGYGSSRLKSSDLDYIVDEEEGEVTVSGKKFHYSDDDSWAALFFADQDYSKSRDTSPGIRLRVYEFEADDGQCLTIESWQEESDDKPEREAFLSRPVTKDKYQLIQA